MVVSYLYEVHLTSLVHNSNRQEFFGLEEPIFTHSYDLMGVLILHPWAVFEQIPKWGIIGSIYVR